MQTPPPFPGYESAQPTKPKKNPLLILFAVIGVLLVCCGLPVGFLAYFGVKGFQGAMAMGGCFANVELMNEAMQKYVLENKGKLPPAATWQSDLGKFISKTEKQEEMPIKYWQKDGEWSCEEGGIKTGFRYNAEVAGKDLTEIKAKDAATILVYETNEIGYNKSGPVKLLPEEQSPVVMGGQFGIKERRGWIVVTASGVELVDSQGKVKKSKNGMSVGAEFKRGFDSGRAGAKAGRAGSEPANDAANE